MKTLKTLLEEFFADDGQDLIEYTLLLAFIALVSAVLLSKMDENIRYVWKKFQPSFGHPATAFITPETSSLVFALIILVLGVLLVWLFTRKRRRN